MPENRSWRTRQLRQCRYVSVMLLRSMQNTRRIVLVTKAENDALRDDVAAGRRRLHIKAKSVSQCVKPPPPPAWIMQPPQPDTAERDYFTLKLILCKNNWKEPRSIY